MPVIQSVSPTSFTVGTAATLIVTGTGFSTNSIVAWNSTSLAMTYNASTGALTATVPASLVVTTGPVAITVSNGTATSSSVPFSAKVYDPTPVITAVTPTSLLAGVSTSIRVDGTNLLMNSVLQLNGVALTTTLITSPTTYLTASVPATMAVAGSAAVTVSTPTAAAASNAIAITVVNPTPVITTVNPASYTLGSAATMTVTVTGFVAGAVVLWNSTPLITTYNAGSGTPYLTAAVPASLVTAAGAVAITVSNPSSAASNAISVTIPAPMVPIVTNGNVVVPAGSTATAIALSGSNLEAVTSATFRGYSCASAANRPQPSPSLCLLAPFSSPVSTTSASLPLA